MLVTILSALGLPFILTLVVILGFAWWVRRQIGTMRKRSDRIEEQYDSLEIELLETRRQMDLINNRLERLDRTTKSGLERGLEPSPPTHPLQPPREVDTALEGLLRVYQDSQAEGRFVPFSAIVDSLIRNGIASSQSEAIKLINDLALLYPRAIRIEDKRGQTDKQIAIYKEMMT